MTMDMALNLGAPVAGTPAQQPAVSGQEASANPQAGQHAGTFGRMLVARVSDGGSIRQNIQTQPVRIAPGLATGEWSGLVSGSASQSLSDQLDALLRLLEGGDGPLTAEQEAEIDAALEELQAIMMALFGIPLPVADETAQTAVPDATDADAADAEQAAGAASRGGLYETVAFVRLLLAEGAFRPLNRQENAMFEALIGRLQRAFAPADETVGQEAEAGRQPVVEIRTTGNETRPSAEALLARLARGPMQASVAAVVTETQQLAGAQNRMIRNAAMPETNVNAAVQASNLQALIADGGETALNPAAESADLTPVAQTVQMPTATPGNVRTEAQVRQPVQTVPVERFHEVVSGMAVRQFALSASNGVSEARILLVPEHLGEVAVRITLQNGQLTAQFMTENAAAKDLIENQFVVLRGVLQSQGIQVERLEVTYGNAAQSQMFQEQRQRGGQNRQEGGRGNRADDSVPVFETELLEQTAIRELGYGRAINVKA